MVSTVEVRAASYHADVYHLGGELTVQSVFSRAWHLRDAGGWILTVTTASYGGPLAIRVDCPCLDALPVEPGMPASIDHDALNVGTLRVSLDGARAWSPRRADDAPPLSFSALQRDVVSLTPSSPGPLSRNAVEGEMADVDLPSPASGRGVGGEGVAASHIEALLDALVHMDDRTIQATVLGLLGLGPGLTPAGDDFLCGLLVGLQVFGRRAHRLGEWASECAAMVARVTEPAAPERTTALSRTLLHYAARSVAIDPLLDVVCTLGNGDPASQENRTTQAGSARGVPGLDELRAIGHSSGSDMLAGTLLAARAVLEQEKMIDSALVNPA